MTSAVNPDFTRPDQKRLYQWTVPVVDFSRGEPTILCTGVPIAVDKQRFIVTASHAFESDQLRRVGFGFMEAQGFRVVGSMQTRIIVANPQARAGDAQRAIYKDGLDIAVIEVSDEVLEELEDHYVFFDLRNNSDVPAAMWGMISGWPTRKNIYKAKRRFCDFETCYHIQCPIVDSEKVRAIGWNADVFIGLSANKAKHFASAESGRRVQLPKLEGISGSGFWVKNSTTSNWSLYGIVVEDHTSKHMIKAVKAVYIWAPLLTGWKLVR